MNTIGLGQVTDFEDEDKFIIKFKIPEVAEDCIAYPMTAEDKPEKDDLIVWFRMDNSILGESFFYKKVNFGKENIIQLRAGDYQILATKNHILIQKDGDAKIEIKDSKVIINGGHLEIS